MPLNKPNKTTNLLLAFSITDFGIRLDKSTGTLNPKKKKKYEIFL